MADSEGVDLGDVERRMQGAVEALRKELASLRTGRATASLLEPVMVEAYGQEMPLNQVGTVSVPESRMLSVQVWDKSMAKAVEKAIRNAGLGLNPAADGTLIRVPVPDLSAERRQELVKVAGRYTEEQRVAVRNIRRNAMDQLKKAQKDGDISEDDQRRRADEVEQMTSKAIGQMNELLTGKEKEITTV